MTILNLAVAAATSAASSVATTTGFGSGSTPDANGIAQQAGKFLMDAISFLTKPGNYSVAIGVAILYVIIMVATKGAGRILETVFEGVVALFVVYMLLGFFGINVDWNGIISQVGSLISNFMKGLEIGG